MQWAVGQATNHLNFTLSSKKSALGPSMSLDKTDVEKIAHLARLAIDVSDIPDYAQDLTTIFGLVEQLSSVNTDGITPMAHPLDAVQRLRPDHVTEIDQREQFQAIAPKTEAGVYLVPLVIE